MSNYYFYKISHKDSENCYVGSTGNLIKRKSQHKKNCTYEKSKSYQYKLYKFIRENGGWDNFIMEELEQLVCENKEFRLNREKELFEIHKTTLNTISPIRTPEETKKYKAEWARNKRENASEEWKEECKRKKNESRAKNADEINSKQRERYAKDEEYKKRQDATAKRYRERNPEKIKEITKAYYDKNAEMLRAKARAWGKQPTTCECGKKLTKSALSNHRKSKAHKIAMEKTEK